MHGNQKSIMDIFMKSVTLFYQFLEYGDWKVIATRSKKSQQGFGIGFRL